MKTANEYLLELFNKTMTMQEILDDYAKELCATTVIRREERFKTNEHT